MIRRWWISVALAGMVLGTVGLAGARAQRENPRETARQPAKYENADDAYRAGLGFLAIGDKAKAQAALEEALRLTDKSPMKVRVYEALAVAYRGLPETDKMVEALDYIIAHADSSALRSLTRSSLLSFMYQRGKLKDLAERYESRLKQTPDDRTALFILSELYDRYAPNPSRGVEINAKLVAVLNKESGKLDLRAAAQLAQQQARTGQFKEAAELYEKLAPLDAKLAAWHWKEAASTWLKAKEKEKALAAARAAASAKPEKRSELLTYFWHKGLADVFLETGEFLLAIEHYEKALEHTDIEGYRRDCLGRLAEARLKAGKKRD